LQADATNEKLFATIYKIKN